MKDLKIGIIVVLCFICFTGYYAYAIADLKISMHEGVFIEERRENPFLFRKEYCFSNENGLKPVFCLDYFSKKEVYPEEFEKGIRYRIYYEKRNSPSQKFFTSFADCNHLGHCLCCTECQYGLHRRIYI